MTVHLSPYAIPGVNILVNINGNLATPREGFLGVLTAGTKISITLEIDSSVEHRCYTIDSKMNRTPKACSVPGYTKNLTVVEKVSGNWEFITRTTQVARWPNNMVCLDLNGKTYNIGVMSQHGRYFFVIEEYVPRIETNELIPIGIVLSSSPLRGIATVHTGNDIINAKIHWSRCPFRKELGFRHLDQGEIILFTKESLLPLGEESSYRYEIGNCSLA